MKAQISHKYLQWGQWNNDIDIALRTRQKTSSTEKSNFLDWSSSYLQYK